MNTIEYYDLIVGKWVSVRSKIRGTTSAKDGIFAAHVNNLLYVVSDILFMFILKLNLNNFYLNLISDTE